MYTQKTHDRFNPLAGVRTKEMRSMVRDRRASLAGDHTRSAIILSRMAEARIGAAVSILEADPKDARALELLVAADEGTRLARGIIMGVVKVTADTGARDFAAVDAVCADAPVQDGPEIADLEWKREQFLRCAPWLEAAMASEPIRTHDLEHVWDDIARGVAQIWPRMQSVAVTTVDQYRTGVKITTVWLGGGDLKELTETLKTIEAYALENGCNFVAIKGRKGWIRALPEYEDAGSLAFKEIA